MAVTLYTSRIILKNLGVIDFGIYNVVGGFVLMLGFLNNAMASASQRFFSFELGKKDFLKLSNIFTMSVNIHLLIALIILIISETIGLWFVSNKLTIPTERMGAALWVYHFSVITLIANMISVPYSALIIAHERMGVFAWVSILEVSLKLLIVILLVFFNMDKLILYAALVFLVTVLVRLVYGGYCIHSFEESKFNMIWDHTLFKTLISYLCWNLWGNIASVIMGQGINILLNIFFGPVVNAARGITYQIRGAVQQFVTNFQMAMNPQIIKSYAAKDLSYVHQLILQGAKFSFYLVFLLSLPILLETKVILRLWLDSVPDHTIIFTRLMLVNVLIDSYSGTLMTAAQATGKIKVYQSVVGGLLILNLPLTYLVFKLGMAPEAAFGVGIGISVLALILRLYIIGNLVELKKRVFIFDVIFKSIFVSILGAIIPYFLTTYVEPSIVRLMFTTIMSFVMVGGSVFVLGLDKKERFFIIQGITGIIKKLYIKF
ncbi:lipopolysaccharide biosynthesis protein [Saccharicrinis sp. 156]|uniref:lipopolysaccharide biosynthesis protein n=1 Tax=Saccharicrinis sp. 156 TaxID=3417574 RepID=UPI003D33C52B